MLFRSVRADFRGFQVAVIAVQILAPVVLTRIQNKPGRVQARQQENFHGERPDIFLKQSQCSKRPGGFIAVDAGADVDSDYWLLTPDFWLTMQREQFEVADFVKQFRSPTMLLRRRFHVTQHGADVNRLAVVAAVIFAELLHAENFTQRREDAKKFLSTLNYFIASQ